MEWVRDQEALEKCVKGWVRFKDVKKDSRNEREDAPERKSSIKKKKNSVKTLLKWKSSMCVWETLVIDC